MNNQNNCPLCRDENAEYKTICDHYFHKDCLDECLKDSNTCPYCFYNFECPLFRALIRGQ